MAVNLLKSKNIGKAVITSILITGLTNLALAELSQTTMTTNSFPAPTSSPLSTTETTQKPAAESIPPTEIAPPFTDVKTGVDYYYAINTLREQGVLQGYPDKTFRPKNQITRAEALEMIIKALPKNHLNPVESTLASQRKAEVLKPIPFIDVLPNDWFHDTTTKAYSYEIISGKTSTEFAPHDNITRAEALKIIIELTQPIRENLPNTPYSDVVSNDWFYTYFQFTRQKNLLPILSSLSAKPNENISRGDLANLIYKFSRLKYGSDFGTASFYKTPAEAKATTDADITQFFTAAHKTLPFGKKIKVINLYTGKEIIVRISDRGPYVDGRIVDLSKTAFSQVANLSIGVMPVEMIPIE